MSRDLFSVPVEIGGSAEGGLHGIHDWLDWRSEGEVSGQVLVQMSKAFAEREIEMKTIEKCGRWGASGERG